jgi:hypothetical protein
MLPFRGLNIVLRFSGSSSKTISMSRRELSAIPPSPVKEAFKVGLLSEEETVKALEMADNRNLTSHTYHEEVAEEIYRQVGDYWKLMDEVFRRIVKRVELDFPGNPAEK